MIEIETFRLEKNDDDENENDSFFNLILKKYKFWICVKKKNLNSITNGIQGIQATRPANKPKHSHIFFCQLKHSNDSWIPLTNDQKKSIGVNSSVMHMSLLMFHFRGNMRVHRSSMVFSLSLCMFVAVIIIFYYLINLSRLQCTKVYVTNEHFVDHFFLFIFGP